MTDPIKQLQGLAGCVHEWKYYRDYTICSLCETQMRNATVLPASAPDCSTVRGALYVAEQREFRFSFRRETTGGYVEIYSNKSVIKQWAHFASWSSHASEPEVVTLVCETILLGIKDSETQNETNT